MGKSVWKYYNKANDTYIPLVPLGDYDETVFALNYEKCIDNGDMIVIFHASGGTKIVNPGILANRDLSMRNRSGYPSVREAALRKENEDLKAATKRAADTHARVAASFDIDDSDLLLTYN